MEIGLPDVLASQWNDIILALQTRGLFRLTKSDYIIWNGLGGSAEILARQIYQHILHSEFDPPDHIFLLTFWKTGCLIKIVIFAWLVYYNKNLTWENL